MAEYMSREDYCETACGKENREGYKTSHNCSMLNVPSADVQPVRRGKWIEKAEDYYRQWQDSGRSWDDMPYFITGLHFACGVCFDKFEVNAEGVEFWDFCPHCGADMRGADNE